MPKTKRASDGSDEHASRKKKLPLYGSKDPNKCKYSTDLYGVVACRGNAMPCCQVSNSECETTEEYKKKVENWVKMLCKKE